jgi:hypothetical protein
LEGVPPSGTLKAPIYLEVPDNTRRTDLANVYLRKYDRISTAINKNSNKVNTAAEITENQGAECLYMVIMNATADGEARGLFGENSVGDTDGDGAPEFLDGWGHPIEFLRWAAGFDSDIQVNANDFGPPPITDPLTIPEWVSAASNDHDPFDLYRLDQPAFRLVPLIFSPGRDETYSLRLIKPHVAWVGISNPANPFSLPGPKLLPWAAVTNPSPAAYLGTDNGDNASTDNIHNHLIGTR